MSQLLHLVRAPAKLDDSVRAKSDHVIHIRVGDDRKRIEYVHNDEVIDHHKVIDLIFGADRVITW